MDKTCPFMTSFVVRNGIVATSAAMFYIATLIAIKQKRDSRNSIEFSLLFFNIGCQQMTGGMLLAGVSLLHDHIHEPGFSPLIWYSVNFDFETCFTMTYLFFFKSSLENAFFKFFSLMTDSSVRLGRLMDKHKIVWKAVIANFVFSVGVVGIFARVTSMVSIVLLSFIPYSPTFFLAHLYSLITNCTVLTTLTLYLKPLVIDLLVFVVTDKIFMGGESAVSESTSCDVAGWTPNHGVYPLLETQIH